MQCWKDLELAAWDQVQIIHCSPYRSLLLDKTHHPWERGTSENANGLLRDWFPKGGSLDDVSDSDELGYEGSCPAARRHAGRRREEMARERDRRDAEGFLARAGCPARRGSTSARRTSGCVASSPGGST